MSPLPGMRGTSRTRQVLLATTCALALATPPVVLYIGPDVEHRRWRLVSPGAVVAVAVWLAVSWAFSYYTARFGTYDKTWGTLGAVVVTLIWLWLAGLSLLFGGELNAETERRRGALPPRRTAV